MVPDSRASPAPVEWASWIVAATALVLVLKLQLLSALLAGLLVFELVHLLAPWLQHRLFSARSRLAAVIVLSTLIIGLVSLAIFGVVAFFRSEAGSLGTLLRKMAEIVDGARNVLPAWLVEHLPADAEELREAVTAWLREHAPELQLWGTEAGRLSFHIVVGMIMGAMVSLREAIPPHHQGPLAGALTQRAEMLGDSFRRVVFAQVRISAINTVFTALYLAILPAFGVNLPLRTTMVVLTFVAGLLPVVGNVISNTVIVIVSLSHSLPVALGSLVFLVVIHKLEYFLNARIIGTQIRARPWELLLAMLVMEAAFGIAGAIAAPVYYAYIKYELSSRGLV
jgi:predicted PurR-regulated permease PerM